MYKLTIGILSYNRPLELTRTLKYLFPLPSNVEVVICDDKSPRLNEIKSNITDFINLDQVRFISNEINIGYDKNLYQLIELSKSNHILCLGDDDYLEEGAVDNILAFINSVNNFECAFIRFGKGIDEKYSRNYNSNIYFDSNTLLKNGYFIYNSIAYSGLLFSKKAVLDYKIILKNYFNSIYIQVAIFTFLNIKYGSYFIEGPGIVLGGDGENGFGSNAASVNIDFDLKDRSSVISNISYHKRLFDVLNKLSNHTSKNLIDVFLKEYKIRSVKAVFEARKLGRKYLYKYFLELDKLNIPGIYIYYPIYIIIFLLPLNLLYTPINFIERKIIFYRNYKTKNLL
jgi:hypothetical protein